MLFADLVAGLGTLTIAILLMMDRLEVWHIYGVTAIGALAAAFQVPAYTAATSLLVPKDQLGRASGLVQVAQGLSQIVAPITAGFLLLAINIHGILLVDFATFLVAVLMLAVVRFPKVERSLAGQAAKSSMLGEVIYGWQYLWVRRGLFAMLCLFAAIFSLGIITALFTPMMLTITSAEWLGVTLTVAGVGMLIGSIVMSAWGGPKRRIKQSKVAPDVQGRVFATRDMISMSMQPMAFLVAGSLADKIFEPLMTANGMLATSVDQWIGVGVGRGIPFLKSALDISYCHHEKWDSTGIHAG